MSTEAAQHVATQAIRLRVLLPTEVLFDEPVAKVIAEAENGSFCLLSRHVDFLAALVPGILICVSESGDEKYMAVDEGLLVKTGKDVYVSTRNAVVSTDLGQLRATVKDRFEVLDERERVARSAVAKLEADFVRRFLALGDKARV